MKAIIRSAAAMNKIELPDNMDKLLIPPKSGSDESTAGVLHLFKSKYLRLITFCFLCIWFTINLVYYGVILNMNSFGGDIYLTTVSEKIKTSMSIVKITSKKKKKTSKISCSIC